ncbi:alpha/beta hydrolase [Enterovirga sp.]|uniref:alpha/beta fold hydrolase n=1 Tax=Enterovirga sp. TaxID=2026350 RepID=UPI0026073274|nr:alpha/beta hydrolase [Enterovirga sp.]MDB5592352.1 Alpha/beta hydrolase [Enterovirga sp.]
MTGSETAADSRAERRLVSIPEGSPVAYLEAGSGPDLVLIHGSLVNADDMRLGPMSALAERFRVVAFDRPGHGLSERARPTDGSVWRQAELLRAAAVALGLRRPVLVGHSFGGAVALAWAMSFPEEVAGVAALAPICFPELRLEHLLFAPRAVPVAGQVLAQTLHLTADPLLLPTLWRAMFLPQSMPDAFARGFSFDLAGRSVQTVREGENAASLFADLSRSALGYPTCRVPVRFLCGSADIVVNNHLHGRAAASLIPSASFAWLPGIGHMLHHMRQAEVVAAAGHLAGDR